MILDFPITYRMRARLDANRRREKRQHWNEMMERMDRGQPIKFPFTTTEELRNERENYD